MKEILSVEARNYPRIYTSWQRTFFETGAPIIGQYDFDYRFLHCALKSFVTNQEYINVLFERVDFLYNYYELERRHFELLDVAATNVERLSHEKIAQLSEATTLTSAKTELATYFDKVTMIFQTAADKAEDDRYRESYAAMAQKYSEKADNIRGTFTASYTAKLQFLYENAATTCEADFIRELLQLRANEYNRKHTEEIARISEGTVRFQWSSEARQKPEEHEPLLTKSQEGLHRRKSASALVPS